jgi:hypothetical protein
LPRDPVTGRAHVSGSSLESGHLAVDGSQLRPLRQVRPAVAKLVEGGVDVLESRQRVKRPFRHP